MKIVIVGAGAIGGWLAVRLAEAGQQVSVLARGATLAEIRREGLSLTSKDGTSRVDVAASDNSADLGAQDLIIIGVKGTALAAVAPYVAAMLGAETVVLPAMNGLQWWFTHGLGGALEGATLETIDGGRRIAALIPPQTTLGCVVHASCSRAAPSHAVHQHGNRLIIGEPQGGQSKRLARVYEALVAAGFEVEASRRIQNDVWFKLWGNMTMNPISALTGALTDRILDDALVKSFALSIMGEAAEVGRKIGCPISESGLARMELTRKLGGIKTSMLQDVEAGRPLEIDALLAAPREIAARIGVPTPFMDALHGLTRLYAAVHPPRA